VIDMLRESLETANFWLVQAPGRRGLLFTRGGQ